MPAVDPPQKPPIINRKHGLACNCHHKAREPAHGAAAMTIQTVQCSYVRASHTLFHAKYPVMRWHKQSLHSHRKMIPVGQAKKPPVANHSWTAPDGIPLQMHAHNIQRPWLPAQSLFLFIRTGTNYVMHQSATYAACPRSEETSLTRPGTIALEMPTSCPSIPTQMVYGPSQSTPYHLRASHRL